MPKICLDPGHSGATYNTGGWGYYESKRMWDFHLLLAQELKNRGFEVITTRSSIDANPELTTVVQLPKVVTVLSLCIPTEWTTRPTRTTPSCFTLWMGETIPHLLL